MSPEQQQRTFDEGRAAQGLPSEPLLIVEPDAPAQVLEDMEQRAMSEFDHLTAYAERLKEIAENVRMRLRILDNYVSALRQVRENAIHLNDYPLQPLPELPELPDVADHPAAELEF